MANILLFIFGALLAYAGQYVLSRLVWHRGLSAGVAFSAAEVAEGDSLGLRIHVENAKPVALCAVKVNLKVDRALEFQTQTNLAVSDMNYRSEIFSLGARERVEREVGLFAGRRGYFHVTEATLVGSDLFHTQNFLRRVPVDEALVVLPGRVNARRLLAVSQRMLGELVVPQSDYVDPFIFKGIRPYQPHDPQRAVNWSATAKTNELQVNTFEFSAQEEVRILLDVQWDALFRPEELLEEGVRVAAAVAEDFIGRSITTSVCSNGRDVLSGEALDVRGGANSTHAHWIAHMLARLELPQAQEDESFEALLDEQMELFEAGAAEHVSWLVVSTKTGAAMRERWRRLQDLANHAVWVVPASSAADLPRALQMDANVMCWEVPSGK